MISVKRIFAILILLECFSPVKAQNFLGLSSSNYAGTHGVMLNPANAVDTRQQLYVNFGAIGAEIQNNYARWNAPYSLLSLMTKTVGDKYLSPTSGLPVWKQEYYKTKEKQAKAYLNGELRGPAIQFSSPIRGIGMAAGIRIRILSSLGNTSPNIATAILSGTKNLDLLNQQFTDESFLFNAGAYNEFFVTFAKVLKEDDSDFLKIGITAKRLTSNNSLSISANSFDYIITPIDSKNKNQNIDVARSEGSFFHASQNTGQSFSWLLDQMTAVSGIGNGFGGDIGFIYEKRPNYARERTKYKKNYIPDPFINKYSYRFGAALTDIGFMKYSSSTEVAVGAVHSFNDFIAPGTFYHIGTTDELVGDIESVYDLDPNTYQRSFNILMPASLTLHADYLIREGFYVSGVLRQFLLSKKRIGPIGFSGLSIIPRFEKKYLEFAFPISLDQDYSNFNLGATMRAGPLFIGFDNITGLINLGNPRGLSLHAGLFWALNHKPLKEQQLECPPFFSQKKLSIKSILKRNK